MVATNVPTIERLQELKLAATDALAQVKRAKPHVPGAINWGHLYIADVNWVMNLDGDDYFEVVIEEVAPDADAFCGAIRARLEERGWPSVMVRTEW